MTKMRPKITKMSLNMVKAMLPQKFLPTVVVYISWAWTSSTPGPLLTSCIAPSSCHLCLIGVGLASGLVSGQAATSGKIVDDAPELVDTKDFEDTMNVELEDVTSDVLKLFRRRFFIISRANSVADLSSICATM